MGESLLVRKAGGGAKINGVEYTVTAAETINAGDLVSATSGRQLISKDLVTTFVNYFNDNNPAVDITRTYVSKLNNNAFIVASTRSYVYLINPITKVAQRLDATARETQNQYAAAFDEGMAYAAHGGDRIYIDTGYLDEVNGSYSLASSGSSQSNTFNYGTPIYNTVSLIPDTTNGTAWGFVSLSPTTMGFFMFQTETQNNLNVFRPLTIRTSTVVNGEHIPQNYNYQAVILNSNVSQENALVATIFGLHRNANNRLQFRMFRINYFSTELQIRNSTTEQTLYSNIGYYAIEKISRNAVLIVYESSGFLYIERRDFNTSSSGIPSPIATGTLDNTGQVSFNGNTTNFETRFSFKKLNKNTFIFAYQKTNGRVFVKIISYEAQSPTNLSGSSLNNVITNAFNIPEHQIGGNFTNLKTLSLVPIDDTTAYLFVGYGSTYDVYNLKITGKVIKARFSKDIIGIAKENAVANGSLTIISPNY
jgi:hypothetical protein